LGADRPRRHPPSSLAISAGAALAGIDIGKNSCLAANIQQTDTVQQFLAYEKCYKITGGYQNCISAHEPLSYTDSYPITKNSWVALYGGRMAEIALAAGEKSHKPQ
jgi:hypothetical protein